jgi:simple sugar transport system ATP-binding protein
MRVTRGEIHGLLGENGAGKSTLMRIVAGITPPDRGTVSVLGQRDASHTPATARAAGIGMVHQHFMLVPTMTVAENIALAAGRTDKLLVDVETIAARVRSLAARYGLDVQPEAVVGELSVGQRQRAEIVRMLFHEPRVLIFDEPTSVLTPQEWTQLASVMRDLARDGRTIILITHKLDEIMAFADRCTVMRDGSVVRTLRVAETTKGELAELMVGHDVALQPTRRVTPKGAPALSVTDLSVRADRRTVLESLNFVIAAGEIFGIAGVDGNGQDELVEALVGLVPIEEGEISIGDTSVPHMTPRRFSRFGGAVVHADRHKNGVAPTLSIADNLMMTEFRAKRYARYGFRRRRNVAARCRELMRDYDIRAPGPDVRVQQLSGGNQQKVVLARELSRGPRILIASQVTRGLDVGAVEFIHGRLLEHKRAMGATLLVSTELEEVLSLADRIAVMSRGRLSRAMDPSEASPERLGLLMAGERDPP